MSSDGMSRWDNPSFREAVAREEEAYRSSARIRQEREEVTWQDRAEKAEARVKELEDKEAGL